MQRNYPFKNSILKNSKFEINFQHKSVQLHIFHENWYVLSISSPLTFKYNLLNYKYLHKIFTQK